jgi:UDP-2-acetamido-2,6-beta-L-arabino-hexul-4-ose reductase
MKVLVTGANGFVGSNLRQHLAERQDIEIVVFNRADDPATLRERVGMSDIVFHLAGVNRPQDPQEFVAGNAGLTAELANALREVAQEDGRIVPVVYASSIQAALDNPYGQSKRAAEESLLALAVHGIPVSVFRLPNVFGKWCRPNYNSAVATFCHNIARDLPIQIANPAAPVTLVYIDDVVDAFLRVMDGTPAQRDDAGFALVAPQYETTVGELARQIEAFRDSRNSLISERVGTGFVRALYSTYVSYLPKERFVYGVTEHGDQRGVFVEFLKTPDSGQFSFFTAHSGITRGGHYHHSKTEKFLVIKGEALFKFRQVQTGETHEVRTSGAKAEIVETVPGWTHDITNIGEQEMIVMLWANEIFDRAHPDTYALPL